MRFCRRSTPFLILISLTLRRYCNETMAWITHTSQEAAVEIKRHNRILLQHKTPLWPRTSEAEKNVAPSPSPQLSRLHWSPSGSFRVVERALSSPSLFWNCMKDAQNTLKPRHPYTQRQDTQALPLMQQGILFHMLQRHTVPTLRKQHFLCGEGELESVGPVLTDRVPEKASCG